MVFSDYIGRGQDKDQETAKRSEEATSGPQDAGRTTRVLKRENPDKQVKETPQSTGVLGGLLITSSSGGHGAGVLGVREEQRRRLGRKVRPTWG